MRIKKCCCCVPLHTGCLIIAIISLISTLAVSFGMSDTIMGGNHQVDDGNNPIAHQSSMIMKFFVCIISFIFCFLLIYGTIKKKRTMLKAWFILMGLQCVGILVLVGKLIYGMKYVPAEAKSIVKGILGAAIVEFIVCFYCWLVVWSRYLELGDEAKAAATANINSPERSKLNDVNASSNC